MSVIYCKQNYTSVDKYSRHTLCYFVAACLVLTTMADFGVWWNAGNIELFDDEEDDKKEDMDVKVKGEKNLGLEMETS